MALTAAFASQGVGSVADACTDLQKGKTDSEDFSSRGCFEYLVDKTKKEATQESCQSSTEMEKMETCVCEPGTDAGKLEKCLLGQTTVSSTIPRFGADFHVTFLPAFAAALLSALA